MYRDIRKIREVYFLQKDLRPLNVYYAHRVRTKIFNISRALFPEKVLHNNIYN